MQVVTSSDAKSLASSRVTNSVINLKINRTARWRHLRLQIGKILSVSAYSLAILRFIRKRQLALKIVSSAMVLMDS